MTWIESKYHRRGRQRRLTPVEVERLVWRLDYKLIDSTKLWAALLRRELESVPRPAWMTIVWLVLWSLASR